jgi:RND family efflux transporter MFP subunit
VPVERRAIAQFLETNGTVESDNDVALVARTSGPIVELLVEEGMKVQAGQLLARIDDDEIRARLALAKVNEGEAELAYQRAKVQYEKEILSRELYDQATAKLEAARAQVHETQVQLDYTSIKAPFTGMIVTRFIKFAQHVQSSTPLFRISAFDPLQCPIQVPEKDLGRLQVGQPAYLTVEAFPGERFEARVLRVSPVVDSATGTVKTTLEVETRGRLRPGMFASVFLETDRHADALVIPKTALVLESIGDTVYIKDGDVAKRREVRLGYDEGDHVEVVAGLEAGQDVIVLGQDSLSDGTPVYVLEPGTRSTPSG